MKRKEMINMKNIKLNIEGMECHGCENRIKNAGFEVANFQGFTCYGIASALSRITRAIAFDENVCLPVCTYLEDYGIFTSTPSIIGKNGVVKANTLDLDKNEIIKLEHSIQTIKTAIGNL